jgi:hypothetical protein
MTGETVECYNCGRANPAWAQVCRSCGVPIRPGAAASQSSGPIPTDRDSLLSIGATLAAIAGAIVLGLVLSGIIPDAPPLAEVVETPEPSLSAVPSGSAAPSEAAESADASADLLGTITFGTGINQADEVLNRTDTFGPGSGFCHSLQLTERFRVPRIQEEVLRVEEDGTLTEVQERRGSNLDVDRRSRAGAWCAPGGADALIADWGAGTFVLRDYRNPDTPELLAEAQFTLTE